MLTKHRLPAVELYAGAVVQSETETNMLRDVDSRALQRNFSSKRSPVTV